MNSNVTGGLWEEISSKSALRANPVDAAARAEKGGAGADSTRASVTREFD